MQTINNVITNEYIINKSKFITKIYPVFKKEEINNILETLNKEYKDATHICYAYILDNDKRANDDGEPGGTAGMPILNVLEQKELNYILAVVIRYFGGIKLGAGGLVRAYSNCVSETITDNIITEVIPGIILQLTYDYNNSKTLDNLLQNYTILNKDFGEKIKITLKIPEKDYQNIKNILETYCCSIIEKERLYIY